MADSKIEQMAGQILEAISDPKVCGKGADALRKQIKRELRRATKDDPNVTSAMINEGSRHIAGNVEDICRGLTPAARAVGVVVVAAGAVYGVTQMSEQEIREAIAKIKVDVVDTRLMVAGRRVDLSLSTTLAPLMGERFTAEAEAKWRAELFHRPGTASLFVDDINANEKYGIKWKAPIRGGGIEAGIHDGGEGGRTIFFKWTKNF